MWIILTPTVLIRSPRKNCTRVHQQRHAAERTCFAGTRAYRTTVAADATAFGNSINDCNDYDLPLNLRLLLLIGRALANL